MKSQPYFDPMRGLICSQDPDKLTPQQRANWTLVQSILEAEYKRGYKKGLEDGKTGLDIPRPML